MNTRVPRRSGRWARHLRGLGLAVAGLLAAALLPASAGADVNVDTFTTKPVTVAGYEVQQSFMVPATHPKFSDSDHGYITRMEVDVVDADGTPVPIQRLMLHHIVFANVSTRDRTCASVTGFDGNIMPGFNSERFYAAGEERAKMLLPSGYGYRVEESDLWGLLYMFMNHRAVTDTAYIQYKITSVSGADAAGIREVDPYWLDVNNCHADPIYNVPGNGGPGSTNVRTYDLALPESGRLVAAGGHVHGGAHMLTLTEPDCGDRELGRSLPTWGNPDHPFYNVRPILHEPGPINMSGFGTPTGIPVAAGERLRLSSIYDDSLPHVRVMGIMIAYVAPDPTVTERCGRLPGDILNLGTDQPGRPGPIPYRIPLTGLDAAGNAETIKNPPGKLKKVRSGTELIVGDHFFLDRNVKIKKGATLDWRFASEDLHNVTVANGPIGIGSDNLNDDRTFSQRFNKKGTYRLFCALHPVQMTERVVVVGKHGKRSTRGRGGSS